MATETFWLQEVNVGGQNSNRLWWDRDPAAGSVTQSTSATGWNLGTSTPRYALMDAGTEVRRQALSTTSTIPNNDPPSASSTYTGITTYGDIVNSSDSISTFYPYNGYFPSGTWTWTFPMIAVSSAAGQDFSLRMRVFAATQSGTTWDAVRELTTAFLSSNTVTNLTTTVTQSCTFTWNPGTVIRLDNEFLICKMAVAYTGSANNNNADCAFRYGSGCTMVTPNFRERRYSVT